MAVVNGQKVEYVNVHVPIHIQSSWIIPHSCGSSTEEQWTTWQGRKDGERGEKGIGVEGKVARRWPVNG